MADVQMEMLNGDPVYVDTTDVPRFEKHFGWTVVEPAYPDGPPSESWLKTELQAYCDDHEIAYTADATKADLLTQITADE